MAFCAQVWASPEKPSWQVFLLEMKYSHIKKLHRFANKQELEQSIFLFSAWLRSWRMVWVNLAGTVEELFLVPPVQVSPAKSTQRNVARPEALLEPPKHFSSDSLCHLCHQGNKLQQKMIKHAEGSQALPRGSCLYLQDKRSQHWHKYWLNHRFLKQMMGLRENKSTWPEELVT